MTRKRFIKLLMGRFSMQCNEARRDVALVQLSQSRREESNHEAKLTGITERIQLHGYGYSWREYYSRYIEDEEI